MLHEQSNHSSLSKFSWIHKKQVQDKILGQVSLTKYPQGLLVDFHGQSHPENRVELGYVISKFNLNKYIISDNVNNTLAALRQRKNLTLEGLIREPDSFGAFLNRKNLSAFAPRTEIQRYKLF